VIFTTDNGAEVMTFPDGGQTPFRGEKATNWEGGYRVPMVMRWPRTIQPLNTRGLQRCMMRLITPPLPAVARPSKTITRAPSATVPSLQPGELDLKLCELFLKLLTRHLLWAGSAICGSAPFFLLFANLFTPEVAAPQRADHRTPP
jgi:hypothetical protein